MTLSTDYPELDDELDDIKSKHEELMVELWFAGHISPKDYCHGMAMCKKAPDE